MKYLIFWGLLIIVFNSGCVQSIEGTASGSWSSMMIVSESNTQINIYNDEDSSVVNVYHSGSFFAPLPKGEKVKIDTIKIFFTKAERDTIFSLVNDLIVHPAKPKEFCTEYIGGLGLTVNYGNQFKKAATYSSVCNWNTLSDKTKQLHDILRRRIKNIYLGEREPINFN